MRYNYLDATLFELVLLAVTMPLMHLFATDKITHVDLDLVVGFIYCISISQKT